VRRSVIIGWVAALATAIAAPAAQADIGVHVTDTNGYPLPGGQVTIYDAFGQRVFPLGSGAQGASADANGNVDVPSSFLQIRTPPYRAFGVTSAACTGMRGAFYGDGGIDQAGLLDGQNVTLSIPGAGATLCGDAQQPGATRAPFVVVTGGPGTAEIVGPAGATGMLWVWAQKPKAVDVQVVTATGQVISTAPGSADSYGYARVQVTLPALRGVLAVTYKLTAASPQQGPFTVGTLVPGSFHSARPVAASKPRLFMFIDDVAQQIRQIDQFNQRVTAINALITNGCIRSTDMISALAYDADYHPIQTPIRATRQGLQTLMRGLATDVGDFGAQTDYNIAFDSGFRLAQPVNRHFIPAVFMLAADHSVGLPFLGADRVFPLLTGGVVNTIGFGNLPAVDVRTLAHAAGETGGSYQQAQTAAELSAAYMRLCTTTTGGAVRWWHTDAYKPRLTRGKSLFLPGHQMARFLVGFAGHNTFSIVVVDPRGVAHSTSHPGSGVRVVKTSSTTALVFARTIRGKYTVTVTAAKLSLKHQRATTLVTTGGR
jgi:hypothetical protein